MIWPSMPIPYPRWWIAILRPLNNKWTCRLRLRILAAFDPPWLDGYGTNGRKTKR